jgi:4-hydroxybenzoate polyprenyltransferase
MLAYTPLLKPRGLPGNVAVSVLASLPFLYGGWSVGRPGPTLALVALAVPLHLAREIAKDLDDAPGDAGARRTLPVAAGPRAARAALLLALLAFLGVLGPFVAVRPRLALLVLPAVGLALLGAWRALRGRRGAPALLKASMLCAMASLLAAR